MTVVVLIILGTIYVVGSVITWVGILIDALKDSKHGKGKAKNR